MSGKHSLHIAAILSDMTNLYSISDMFSSIVR